jgi:hypothetical protein
MCAPRLTLAGLFLRVSLHARRCRQSARHRVSPFNLKAGGRAPRLRLAAAEAAAPVGWVGPWVDLGPSGPLGPVGRLAHYIFNEGALWVAGPAKAGWGPAPHTWLQKALRGLTGRVSLKLRFKGKSFRWHRRRGNIVLRFGHSHLVTCPPPRFTRWKKHGKAKMVFFHSNAAVLRDFLLGVVRWREPNRYHSRGIRLSRQIITRKAGKVSAYR